jgi:hypothetical protein
MPDPGDTLILPAITEMPDPGGARRMCPRPSGADPGDAAGLRG